MFTFVLYLLTYAACVLFILPSFTALNATGCYIAAAVWLLLGPCVMELLYDAVVKSCSKHSRPYQHYIDLTQQYVNNPATVPVLYRHEYNITVGGIEKLHPFDSRKYGHVAANLVSCGLMEYETMISPPALPRTALLSIHSPWYLALLHSSTYLSRILELPLCILPSSLLHWRVLHSMLYATSGSALGAMVAYEKGWAINLGGGFHHASKRNGGGGFCVYADITLAIQSVRTYTQQKLRRTSSTLNDIEQKSLPSPSADELEIYDTSLLHQPLANVPLRVMIVDLDAHQGNGHEHDFINDPYTFIFDMYNPRIYPGDRGALPAIRCPIHVTAQDDDSSYLHKLRSQLYSCIQRFVPQFIIYNAGTDCMANDPLGQLQLSAECVMLRDELVVELAQQHRIPWLMLLSGGYQRCNAPVIAQSIRNIIHKFELLPHKHIKKTIIVP